jgi:hypothetical protein
MSFKGRQQANREILAVIAEYVERWPDMRFGQLLSALDVNVPLDAMGLPCPALKDTFYEEPSETLGRVYMAKAKLEES